MNLANDETPSAANKQKSTWRDFILHILMNSILGGAEEEKSNNLMDAEMEERVSLIKLNSKDKLYFFSHVIMAKFAR